MDLCPPVRVPLPSEHPMVAKVGAKARRMMAVYGIQVGDLDVRPLGLGFVPPPCRPRFAADFNMELKSVLRWIQIGGPGRPARFLGSHL